MKLFYIEQKTEDVEDIPVIGEWHKIGLSMCYAGENCGCFQKGTMDDCDNIIYETKDEELAKERLQIEKENGNTVRLMNKECS